MTFADLPLAAQEDLRRFASYGWLPGIIARLLNRTNGLELTAREVKKLMCQVAQERKDDENK